MKTLTETLPSMAVAVLFLALPAVGQPQFAYTTNHGTIAITRYSGPSGAVTIPAVITGLPVTSIGAGVFSNTYATSVTIPNSVTTIGDQAFSSCDSLPEVSIPSGVTAIGKGAFSACLRLISITVDALSPAYLSVDGVLFNKNQTALIQYPAAKAGVGYTIPNSVSNIADLAFSYCGYFYGGLTSVTIPESVTAIGDRAFCYCSLSTIAIGSSVTTIGNGAFTYCGLTSVILPDSVTSIGAEAFAGCGLTNIVLGNSVASIGNGAFSYCVRLTNVTIPNGVISIGDGAFSACEYVTNITIPNSVTRIGDAAFYGCSRLTSVIIPDSVTALGGAAFAGCLGLTKVTIGNGVSSLVAAWMDVDSGLRMAVGTFEGCVNLTDVTIPNCVANIGNRAFDYCWSLTNVMIPTGVISIGDQAFSDCYGLTSVYFQGNAPSLDGSSVFNGVNDATVFYLPGTAGWGTTFGDLPTAPWVLPNPLILNFGSSFGVQSNRFGFIISWAANIPVVIEASTNLGNPIWFPLGTNILTSGSSYFSDPQWTDYPNRFYRVRSL